MISIEKLNFNTRKKLINNQALSSDEISEVIAHKLYLFGSVLGFNPLDRYNIEHHCNRVKWYYDKEQPNHAKIKETVKLHKLDLKYNPIRTYDKLEEIDLINIREMEQHQLHEDYISKFSDIEKLRIGYLKDDILKLTRLTDFHNDKQGIREFANDLKNRK